MKHEEDWLDTLLHDDAQHAVADAGFTARVMQRLPAAVVVVDSASDRRFARWTLVGAFVGTLIALLDGAWPDTEAMSAAITSIMNLRPTHGQALAPWLATLLVAAVLAYVMLEEQG
jgi:cbb3-type cytochrome oxidase subunit 1